VLFEIAPVNDPFPPITIATFARTFVRAQSNGCQVFVEGN